jgi:hypothetical protein
MTQNILQHPSLLRLGAGQAEASTTRYARQLPSQTGRTSSRTIATPSTNPNPSAGISQDSNFFLHDRPSVNKATLHSPYLRELGQDAILEGLWIKSEVLKHLVAEKL